MKVGSLVIADWAIALRSIDAHVVSRYRQAMRAGAVFPRVIVDKATKEVISGNHRTMAMQAEFGDGYEIDVDARTFKNQAAKLKVMAEENSKHGLLMDGFTRRKMAAAMIDEGMTPVEVAAVFNVPVQVVEKWGGQTVLVLGGKGACPVKFGIDSDVVVKMTQKQYSEHCDKDYGIMAKNMARQLLRWIEAGWINFQDEETNALFSELEKALNTR